MAGEGAPIGPLPMVDREGQYDPEQIAQLARVVEQNILAVNDRIRKLDEDALKEHQDVLEADEDETITGKWTFEAATVFGESADANRGRTVTSGDYFYIQAEDRLRFSAYSTGTGSIDAIQAFADSFIIGSDPGGPDLFRVGGSAQVEGELRVRDDQGFTFNGAGQIALKRSGSNEDSPFISFHEGDGTRIGYLQMRKGTSSRVTVDGNESFLIRTNNANRLEVEGDGDVVIAPSGSGGFVLPVGTDRWAT